MGKDNFLWSTSDYQKTLRFLNEKHVPSTHRRARVTFVIHSIYYHFLSHSSLFLCCIFNKSIVFVVRIPFASTLLWRLDRSCKASLHCSTRAFSAPQQWTDRSSSTNLHNQKKKLMMIYAMSRHGTFIRIYLCLNRDSLNGGLDTL